MIKINETQFVAMKFVNQNKRTNVDSSIVFVGISQWLSKKRILYDFIDLICNAHEK